MTYWETLEENRRRSGLVIEKAVEEKKYNYEKKNENNNDKRWDEPAGTTVFGPIRWMKVTDGTYRLYVPSGTEYNLLSFIKVSLANPVDARINVPFLENTSDQPGGNSWLQKLTNLARQYGDMISVTVEPKGDMKAVSDIIPKTEFKAEPTGELKKELKEELKKELLEELKGASN